MTAPQNFNNFALSIPRDQILRRLGYHSRRTDLPLLADEKISRWIDEAFSLCEPRGQFVLRAISRHAECETVLADPAGEIVLSSVKLAENLAASGRVALLTATVGERICTMIAEKTHTGDGAAAVVYDATASETVEAAIEQMDEYIRRLYRSAAVSKFRFSPGFGDWDLSAQKIFTQVLDFSALKITLTDRYQLSPEKTITAIRGLA